MEVDMAYQRAKKDRWREISIASLWQWEPPNCPMIKRPSVRVDCAFGVIASTLHAPKTSWSWRVRVSVSTQYGIATIPDALVQVKQGRMRS